MHPTELIIAVIVGLATGLVSAFGCWWLLFRGLVPRMSLCNTVARYYMGDEDVPRFQVRFSSGARAIIELRVTVSMRFPG